MTVDPVMDKILLEWWVWCYLGRQKHTAFHTLAPLPVTSEVF